jgi:hypothetical protein
MNIEELINNQYVIATLTLFLALYGSMSALSLPKWFTNLFKNDIFRVLFLSLLLIVPFESSPRIAIIIALIFVITMNSIDMEERQNMIKSESNN